MYHVKISGKHKTAIFKLGFPPPYYGVSELLLHSYPQPPPSFQCEVTEYEVGKRCMQQHAIVWYFHQN